MAFSDLPSSAVPPTCEDSKKKKKEMVEQVIDCVLEVVSDTTSGITPFVDMLLAGCLRKRKNPTRGFALGPRWRTRSTAKH